MHGNVGEWCNDLDTAPDALKSSPDAIGRVNRGSGFLSSLAILASGVREVRDPVHRMIHIGFRVAFVTNSKTASSH